MRTVKGETALVWERGAPRGGGPSGLAPRRTVMRRQGGCLRPPQTPRVTHRGSFHPHPPDLPQVKSRSWGEVISEPAGVEPFCFP